MYYKYYKTLNRFELVKSNQIQPLKTIPQAYPSITCDFLYGIKFFC